MSGILGGIWKNSQVEASDHKSEEIEKYMHQLVVDEMEKAVVYWELARSKASELRVCVMTKQASIKIRVTKVTLNKYIGVECV